MRKSTFVVLAILLLGMVALTVIYNYYVSQLVDEAKHAKALKAELKADVADGSRFTLDRVRGKDAYVVHDPDQWGLVCQAEPSAASWRADPSGFTFGKRVALRLFETYGSERPIRWVELRLRRPDGTSAAAFGFERGEGGQLVPVGGPR